MKERKAVYAGSFDPMHVGHVKVIQRALKLFDEIHVLVANSPTKKNMFNLEQRVEIAKLSLFYLSDRVKVIGYEGIVAKYVVENNMDAFLRGVRNATDLDYEFKLEQYNKRVGSVETVYLAPHTNDLNTSSSLVRDFLVTKEFDFAKEYLVDDAHNYIVNLLK